MAHTMSHFIPEEQLRNMIRNDAFKASSMGPNTNQINRTISLIAANQIGLGSNNPQPLKLIDPNTL